VSVRVCVSWVEIRATWRRSTKGQVCVCVCDVCVRGPEKNTFSFRCHDATFYVALYRAIMSNVFFTNWGAKHKKNVVTYPV